MEMRDRDWSALPSDLLTTILSRVFFDNIYNFRNVCKSWRSVPSPLLPSPIDCPIKQSKWLLFMRQCNVQCNFYHPLYTEFYRIDVPELSRAVVRFSKDGWLLVSQGERSIFFFNPFTKAKIDLPMLPKPEGYSFNAVCFSSLPTCSDCMVFGIFGYSPIDAFLSFIRHGQETWTVYKLKNNLQFHPSQSNPVFYNGAFYCLGHDGKLGVFDPREEENVWTVLNQPKKPCDIVDESYMMECDGNLFSVFVGNMGTWLSVFRLDHSEMTWKRVHDLGDNMLFVSHCTSFSAKKMVDGMENKIYFPRFHVGGDGVFYSVATGMFQSFGSAFSRKDLYNTKEQMHCTWIEPSSSRTHTQKELDWLANP